LREVTPRKGERKRKHDHCCTEMFLRFFGPSCQPKTLTKRDWDRFIDARRSGAGRPARGKQSPPVGERTIQYELQWLRAVLNWATLAGDERGAMLLDRNLLRGLELPQEVNPGARWWTTDDTRRCGPSRAR